VGALGHFARGLRASVRPEALGAIAWTYAACLAFAAGFAALVYRFVMGTVAGTAMAGELRHGPSAWWAVDLAGTAGAGASMRMLAATALLMAPVYLVVAIFASGGVVSSVRSALGLGARAPFLRASARNAPSIALVAVVEVIVIGLLAIALLVGLASIALSGAAGAWAWLLLAAGAFAIALVGATFDYARVWIVARDGGSPLQGMVEAIQFTGRRAPAVALLVVLNGALALGVLATAAAAHAALPLETTPGLIAGIAAGQLGVLARLWARVVAYASEASVFEEVASGQWSVVSEEESSRSLPQPFSTDHGPRTTDH
jgi:hypothetical protein